MAIANHNQASDVFPWILQVFHIILVSAGIFLPQTTLSTTYVLPPKMIQRTRHRSNGCNYIVNPMAIQTRTVQVKARAAKADVASGLRPTRRRTRSASQSPTGKSVTAHLAALNLPGLRFDGDLKVLGPEGRKVHDDDHDLEARATITLDDDTPPDSPVGMEDGTPTFTQISDTTSIAKPTRQVVRIAESTPSPPAAERPNKTDERVVRGSVLKNPSPVPPVLDEPLKARVLPRGLEQGRNYVIDRTNKLYIVEDENGQETRFHVEDFVGLFPSWPIIEMSIAPTGTTKDERMKSFVRCVAALLAEIKHVDENAAIAPYQHL